MIIFVSPIISWKKVTRADSNVILIWTLPRLFICYQFEFKLVKSARNLMKRISKTGARYQSKSGKRVIFLIFRKLAYALSVRSKIHSLKHVWGRSLEVRSLRDGNFDRDIFWMSKFRNHNRIQSWFTFISLSISSFELKWLIVW